MKFILTMDVDSPSVEPLVKALATLAENFANDVRVTEEYDAEPDAWKCKGEDTEHWCKSEFRLAGGGYDHECGGCGEVTFSYRRCGLSARED